MSDARYNRICWKGDWREIPKACGGNVEVWDQTIGCPECGMNIWHLPDREKWPTWAMDNAPTDNHWSRDDDDFNPYAVFVDLFTKIHPFQFDDAHDPGDEDRRGSEQWTIGP